MSNTFLVTEDVRGTLVFLTERVGSSIRGEERARSVGRSEQGNERAGDDGSHFKLPTVSEGGRLAVSPAIATGASFRLLFCGAVTLSLVQPPLSVVPFLAGPFHSPDRPATTSPDSRAALSLVFRGQSPR